MIAVFLSARRALRPSVGPRTTDVSLLNGVCETEDEGGKRGRLGPEINSRVLSVELDCVDALLLLEAVPSIDVDRDLVGGNDHEDVGTPGSETCVVLAKQRHRRRRSWRSVGRRGPRARRCGTP